MTSNEDFAKIVEMDDKIRLGEATHEEKVIMFEEMKIMQSKRKAIKATIEVISEPVTVRFECPYCENDISSTFNDFTDRIGEVCDWKYTEIECPECCGIIEIDGVDWN